jgi:hypothetical protein
MIPICSGFTYCKYSMTKHLDEKYLSISKKVLLEMTISTMIILFEIRVFHFLDGA